MQIWVGITTKDLSTLSHRAIEVAAPGGRLVASALDGRHLFDSASTVKCVLNNGKIFTVAPDGHKFDIPLIFTSSTGTVTLSSLSRAGAKGAPIYNGALRVEPIGDSLRASIRLTLDGYLEGVLTAEMPASYHAEALKGQALCARTYALRPRISHDKDNVNVCDSFLCCQYFAGHGNALDARIKNAIDSTANQVIYYQGAPILALFSSNAGGHTEDYQNSFSDPVTGAFPPPQLPYLKGVAEGSYPGFTGRVGSEQFLRYLHSHANMGVSLCADNWTPKFHFSHTLKASDLESHMHHTVQLMQADKETHSFITAPAKGVFGHIKKFVVQKRGVSGQAIELVIETSHGDWLLRKELIIRKAFAGTRPGLSRLSSARIFFDHSYDKLGLLTQVQVGGLGFGHGVGFQQTGAQGLARQGMDYRRIIAHYFKDTQIVSLT
jgi:stage II sporulation protein D